MPDSDAILRTIEVNNQANEYTELLNQALQIGMSVYQEAQKISEAKESLSKGNS